MSSQEKSSTSTTTSKPYNPAYTNYQQAEAKRLYQQGGPEYFPYSTVAPINPYQQQSYDLASQGAAGMLDPVYKNIESKVLPSVQAAYTAAGRSPGGAGSYAENATKALTEAYAPYAMQQYNTDYNRLYQAGQDYNQYNQANIQDAINRWQYYGNLPWDQLARYQGGIQAGGGTTSQTSPYYTNPALSGLGGVTSLLGALSLFSNSRFKEDIVPIYEPLMRDTPLDTVRKTKVYSWRYKGDPETHLGPLAEDWHENTGLSDGVTVNVQDEIGLLMGAVQELADKVEAH